jgi:hypothetical protein
LKSQGWQIVGNFSRVALFLQAGLLLLAWPVAAQVRLGEVTSSLNGNIAPGYTADFGNVIGSDHTWTLGGVANYSGSFYNPNFLSFNASMYLNQSRANSDYQSISDASGINISSTVFGGGHFPGSISYSKAYNTEGSYSVPGLANYVTHGNNDTFGVNWNESLPNAPSFSAGFQMGSSQYSVYGTNDQGTNAFHSLNLHSSYTLAGFAMGAFYSLGGGHALIPEVVAGEQAAEQHSDSSAMGFNVSHQLPLHGSASAGINRSTFDSEYLGSSNTGTIDLLTALAAIHPYSKLSFSASANYSDNLAGQLVQSVVNAGATVPGLSSNGDSNSLDLMGVSTYTPAKDWQTSVYIERRTQNYLGSNYGVTSIGGTGAYSRVLLNGNFNATLNVTENTSDQTGEDTLGFSTTENYSNEILGWKVSGEFGYAQNVQTLLVTYMNSYYNYTGNARHRWGRLNVSMGAGASRTALTEQPGTANTSESFSGSVGYSPWITANGNYSKASGQALATGSGLVPVPVPSPILPSSQVSLYGGDSYSFALASSPKKGLSVSGSYAKSSSNTSSDGVVSLNGNTELNGFVQYQVRQLWVNAGYSRLEQSFSGSGTPPEVLSSFYIGVSRWFKVF